MRATGRLGQDRALPPRHSRITAGNSLSGSVARSRSQVERDARAHGRRHGNFLDIGAFGPGRTGAGHGIHESADVFGQFGLVERHLADTGMDDAGFFDLELHFAALGSFDGGFGSSYLARIVGQKKAREIWFLCRQYTAQEAMDMGLVNKVVPQDLLEDEVVTTGSVFEKVSMFWLSIIIE